MISHAIQKGRFVVAYNSQNHRIFEKCGELKGRSIANFRISRDESNDEHDSREVSGEGGCGIMLFCLFLAFLAAILGCILK